MILVELAEAIAAAAWDDRYANAEEKKPWSELSQGHKRQQTRSILHALEKCLIIAEEV